MIFGAHVVLYSKDAAADRSFFGDVLGLASVDAGHGWLIFALPPSEAAVHPAEVAASEGHHEMYLLCDDLEAEIRRLADKGVACEPVADARWGSVTRIELPSGGRLGLYQPRHPVAISFPWPPSH
jgi:catechol 2,3-dioxygenase-like lactoylglutathione lyase family enzyme